jgi:ferredoxin-NADP reductase
MGATADGEGYIISVRHSSDSRGGSWFLHTRVRVGIELDISHPINNFAVADTARRHILIAGGMGITPMLAMLEELQRDKANVELHYAVRSEIEGKIVSKLPDSATHVIRIYSSDRGEHIPLDAILGERSTGSHVYVCGPQRMIDAVLDVAKRSGWPKETVHSESPTLRETPVLDPVHAAERAGEYSGMLEAYLMKMLEFPERPPRSRRARRALNSPLQNAAKPIPAGYSVK